MASSGTGGGDSIVCIGDTHGNLDKLLILWKKIEDSMGTAAFDTATVIFLGDYCDRGCDPRGMLSWLVALPEKYPRQEHVFLAGNHDFAMAAFIGALPDPPFGFKFRDTWEGQYEGMEERPGWWSGPQEDDMHLQGRRWAGMMPGKEDSTYASAPTFASYGVKHGDFEGLVAAVPEAHRRFLKNLAWVHERSLPDGTRLIAVHAGLEDNGGQSVEEQLSMLRRRDVTLRRIEAISGRANVWSVPRELVGTNTLMVSGHHGSLFMDAQRIIMDESAGFPGRPLGAVLLPSRIVIKDMDAWSDPWGMGRAE
eukprot:jgi/Mesvir1/26164/Mv06863-RA.1